MKNIHAISIKLLNPTNYNLYHRIKLTSNRFNHSIILERDYDMDDSMEQVITWLTEHGFNIIGRTIVSSLDVILTDTFNPLKETK